MTPLTVRVLRPLLVLPLLLVAARARADKPAIGARVGGSERADVYGGVQHPNLGGGSVVKVLHPGIWVKERFHFRDARTLRAYGEEVARATAALHGDAKRGDFFRRLVPEVALDRDLPGFLFMAPRQGVPFAKLTGVARDKAQRQMRRAFGSARRILGTPVNEDPDNFLFDAKSGDATAWLGFLPQPAGTARPYVRTKKEPLGDGLNAVAYLIKNEAPGEGHLNVLKMMWPYSAKRIPIFGTEEVLGGMGFDIVYSARRLAPKLREQFGFEVIPDSVTHDPGIVLQELSAGLPIDKLSGPAQSTAQTLGTQIISAAEQIMPKAKFSKNVNDQHFRFDPRTGKPVRGWFDWLSDSRHQWEGGKRTSFRPSSWRPE